MVHPREVVFSIFCYEEWRSELVRNLKYLISWIVRFSFIFCFLCIPVYLRAHTVDQAGLPLPPLCRNLPYVINLTRNEYFSPRGIYSFKLVTLKLYVVVSFNKLQIIYTLNKLTESENSFGFSCFHKVVQPSL